MESKRQLKVSFGALLRLMSGSLPLAENPRAAVESILISLDKFYLNSDFLRYWLYTLIYRERMPLDQVWKLVEDLPVLKQPLEQSQNQPTCSTGPTTTATRQSHQRTRLSNSSLKFLFEAHHRLNSQIQHQDLYFFEYIAKNEVKLTPRLCESLMHECAYFSNPFAARKLMNLMDSQSVQSTAETYNLFIIALTRHVGLNNISKGELREVLSRMKDRKVVPSVRIYNSLARWGSDGSSFDDGEASEEARLERVKAMLEAGVVPDLSTATVMVQSCLKKYDLKADYILDDRLKEMLDIVFDAAANGEVKAKSPADGQAAPLNSMTVADMMEQFTELVFKYSRAQESSAAVVIITTYTLAQPGGIEKAVELLPRIRNLPMKQSSRVYGELLRGALIVSREDLVKKISQAMISEGVVPDKYVYHQLIKADFERGKFEEGLKLLDSLFAMNKGLRSNLMMVDDFMVADLISFLGKMGEYEMVFVIYGRFKNGGSGEDHQLGPRALSKILDFASPVFGEDHLNESTAPLDDNRSPIPPRKYPSVTRNTTFFPPVSAIEIISDYTSQPGAQIDSAVCSAAISAIIRSNQPPSMIPQLLKKFESCGVKLSPSLLCYTAEAFASTRNLEGVEWVIRILDEFSIESGMTTVVEREVWRRVWMANLSAASKLGNVDAVEAAIRGLCIACMPKHVKIAQERRRMQFGIDLEVLSDLDRSRIMRAVDGLLGAKARNRDVHGVKSLLVIMRDQVAVPSERTLRLLYNKGLEKETDSVMGENWLLKTLSPFENENGE
ncbi:UNVERIFIED_CONTAM: hypothetical protein HDU68_004923 [Siphonaria sp. JEL0065]|nr:hypothetical protein HDU68_004923 [Siphonaria sp. JEL0065]